MRLRLVCSIKIAVYHGADGVRPRVVPVSGDGRTGLDVRGKLESTRGSIIVAGELSISGIGDGVAACTW